MPCRCGFGFLISYVNTNATIHENLYVKIVNNKYVGGVLLISFISHHMKMTIIELRVVHRIYIRLEIIRWNKRF